MSEAAEDIVELIVGDLIGEVADEYDFVDLGGQFDGLPLPDAHSLINNRVLKGISMGYEESTEYRA